MNPRSENPTVYSTRSGRICPLCGLAQEKCRCAQKKAPSVPGDGIVRVSRESKGRGGKVVSVISGLRLSEESLKKLAGDLKRLCGSGGAVKNGQVEIQGDHRDTLVDALKKLGFTVKKVG